MPREPWYVKLRLPFLWSIKNELLLTFVVGIIFAVLAVPAIRAVDPTSAVADLGIVHLVLLAPLVVVSGVVVFWVIVNLGLTFLDRWFDSKGGQGIREDFVATTPAVRLFFFLGVFAVIMLSYSLALLAFI
jgi:hypothetical protein